MSCCSAGALGDSTVGPSPGGSIFVEQPGDSTTGSPPEHRMRVCGCVLLCCVVPGLPILLTNMNVGCSHLTVLGRTAFGSPNSIYLSNPKTGIKQIILRILRFLAESSGVTKLELFQLFPHCKWGFSRCTDCARLRQDSATKDIKTGTKL